MKSSRKIRENILFTWGYSRNSEIKTFSHKTELLTRGPSTGYYIRKGNEARRTEMQGVRGPMLPQTRAEATRPPEKQEHLCGAPLGTEGNPNRACRASEEARGPCRTDKGRNRRGLRKRLLLRTGLLSPATELNRVQLPLGP